MNFAGSITIDNGNGINVVAAGGDGGQGASSFATTTIVGDLVQTAGSTLVVDADFSAVSADVLDVRGRAMIDGTVDVSLSTISNRSATVVTTTGGISAPASLAATRPSQLYSFAPRTAGNTLQIHPRAHFAEAAARPGANRRAVAGELQALFEWRCDRLPVPPASGSATTTGRRGRASSGRRAPPALPCAHPAHDELGRFAVGLDLLGAPNVNVSLQYNPDFVSGYTSHAGVARFSHRF